MADEAAISKLIAFDMDGTLLEGRVIYSLGQRFGFTSKIEDITKSSRIAHERSRRIAKLLRGIRVSEFIEIVRAIPLTKGVTQTVRHLQAENYIGVISDRYTLATDILTNRLKLDFQVANKLEVRNGVITGRITMPLGWEKFGYRCRQSVCKHVIKK
ncbi:MAG: hypothetical protein A3K61_05810 [Thaumarchaeota archaeon RBG_16_49_8]|nr:MAG: hypothetical protein A3K61_05810 [Thaumarchaeota archaeon RBG_16_49_8]